VFVSRFPILLAILTRMSCMDPAPSQPTSPSPVSAPAPTTPAPSGPSAIFITPAGFSPSEVTIAVGGRVTFINDDTRPHDLVGGLDPARPECPEIAIAGFLSPGQRRDTGVFTAARDRDFHDHAAIGVPAVQGKILIR
jgi:streptogramin lyase